MSKRAQWLCFFLYSTGKIQSEWVRAVPLSNTESYWEQIHAYPRRTFSLRSWRCWCSRSTMLFNFSSSLKTLAMQVSDESAVSFSFGIRDVVSNWVFLAISMFDILCCFMHIYDDYTYLFNDVFPFFLIWHYIKSIYVILHYVMLQYYMLYIRLCYVYYIRCSISFSFSMISRYSTIPLILSHTLRYLYDMEELLAEISFQINEVVHTQPSDYRVSDLELRKRDMQHVSKKRKVAFQPELCHFFIRCFSLATLIIT